MSAYVEVHVKGNARALIECSSIAGIVTAPNMTVWDIGSPQAPIALILRGGETIETIGESAGRLLVRTKQARNTLRSTPGLEIFVSFLEPLEGDDGEAEAQV